MIRLKDLLTEIKIKVLSGHLTAKDKKVVKQMLDKKMDSGRVGKADYFIKDLGNNKYEITQRMMDAGIGIGAKKVLRNYKSKIQIKESLLVEKQDKKMFDKIVKALKDVKFRATIHLNDEDKITIALGRDYFKKGYDVEVEKRLKKAGITKGFQLPQGIDIMADSSDIGDKEYTKAQHNIRGGV